MRWAYYAEKQRQLYAELQQADGVEHRGTIGAARETAVRRALASVLPTNVGVAHGEMLGSSGARSPELDVVLYDATLGGPLFRYEDVGVFPAEAVLAVMSVRTTLDVDHLTELTALARDLRDFQKFPRHLARRAGDLGGDENLWPPDADPPPGLFAVARSGPPLDRVAAHLKAAYERATEEHPEFPEDVQLNGVAILERGYVTTVVQTEQHGLQLVPMVKRQPFPKLLAYLPIPDHTLGMLCMALLYFLAYQPRTMPNFTRYYDLVTAIGGQVEAVPLPV